MSDAAKYFSGDPVRGDDLSEREIAEWIESERRGCWSIEPRNEQFEYGQHVLNRFHLFSALGDRSFRHCLGFGPARGDELVPIADRVEAFTCIEPTEQWWQRSIGGKPANYVFPDLLGKISLPDGGCDLVTCLSALHHVPNAQFVLSEFGRVCDKGGFLVMREPIHTLGDWTKPRRGLTRNERGFPIDWLRRNLKEAGFEIVRLRYCEFPGIRRFGDAFHLSYLNSFPLVLIDWMIATSLAWNLHYHRDNLFKKFAPASAAIVARRV